MKRYIALYFAVITIPLLLGLAAWQSIEYTKVEKELVRLEEDQRQWIESNKRLIAGIAVLSSSERIEHLARHDLGLVKKEPESVLQIRIEGRGNIDG
ncbi:septum formation initiator family protein [Breznakiella homolactica]|uniref:Septum formation initiator family protein n=1 Tax=Breznakiella homolactica TaxID=2798577 RepID=A0A7T8B9P1_9SPIR|nr:septum formation initiator family protein [Breznakiella homolactica]QQO07398.1 septum formation initiator family protein [Breznakiella homolactica]